MYHRFLDAIEEAKRRAQPWQCEVTVLPQGDDAATPVPAPTAKSVAAKPGFSCDEPE